MLEIKRTSVWKRGYNISSRGRLIATWSPSGWGRNATITLDRHSYSVRVNMWGTKYDMTDERGILLGAASGIGRKRWTIEAQPQVYDFERASIWRQEMALLSGGRPSGYIKRVSSWRSDAVADLPELPLLISVFAAFVTVNAWDAAAAAAAA